MKYEVLIDPQAEDDLKHLHVSVRRKILDWIARVLTANPAQVSKSRIKRLRGLDSPQYRLRVDDHRVFYDVVESVVYVLRILKKSDVEEYLQGRIDEPPNHQS